MKINATAARMIVKRALQPRKSEIEYQLQLAQKKIRLAARLKHDTTRFEVLGELMSVEQASAIAVSLALRLKSLGFTVKIRKNELLIKWEEIVGKN